jgi:hypothetical protein
MAAGVGDGALVCAAACETLCAEPASKKQRIRNRVIMNVIL